MFFTIVLARFKTMKKEIEIKKNVSFDADFYQIKKGPCHPDPFIFNTKKSIIF